MLNVAPHVLTDASELAVLVRENLDELATYATHLVGDADAGLEYVAAGIHHAGRYPPARIRVDGRVSLFRAVTRACRHEQRFPPRPTGPARFFKRSKQSFHPEVEADAAARMNTVKRALATVAFERRAAVLLHDMARLSYKEVGRALECSPEAASRLLAGARREFGSIYREIAL
jgi:DNA-directed RNA polymerase specialized sigma24 family protein